MRKRTFSSNSFASISSNSEEQNDVDDSKHDVPDFSKDLNDNNNTSCVSNREQTFLTDVYGVTSSESSIKDVKLSMEKGKGKEKLVNLHSTVGKDKLRESEEVESSDSEVEWEDVEPAPRLGTQLEEFVDLQHHGFASHGFSVPIEVTSQVEVEENEDNSNILATLKENKQMLTSSYLPTISKWIEVKIHRL